VGLLVGVVFSRKKERTGGFSLNLFSPPLVVGYSSGEERGKEGTPTVKGQNICSVFKGSLRHEVLWVMSSFEKRLRV